MPELHRAAAGGWAGALPSHLLFCQAADLLEVTDSAIANRVMRGTLGAVDVLGRTMVPTVALVEQHPRLIRLPVALPPSETTDVLARAQRAIQDGEGERPSFSALEIAGIFLSLTWPSTERK